MFYFVGSHEQDSRVGIGIATSQAEERRLQEEMLRSFFRLVQRRSLWSFSWCPAFALLIWKVTARIASWQSNMLEAKETPVP